VSTALITGITGQDGGYLAEQLVAGGYLVHGVLRPAEQLPEHLLALGDKLVVHRAELVDSRAVAGVLDIASPDEIYNLAGISSVSQSWASPVETLVVNATSVGVLLEQAWQHQERHGRPVRVVQASSAEIFAGAREAPQSETTAVTPRSPYGASKALGHHLVGVYRARGMHASSMILYNHESPRRPASFVTRKITSTVAAIAQGRAHRLVLGNTSAKRDWGWAPEYADAMHRAAGRPDSGDYVIATGESHSVEEFVAEAFNCVAIDDWANLVERQSATLSRPTDAAVLVGDASRAARMLDWRPRTTFREVVARLVAHDLQRG